MRDFFFAARSPSTLAKLALALVLTVYGTVSAGAASQNGPPSQHSMAEADPVETSFILVDANTLGQLNAGQSLYLDPRGSPVSYLFDSSQGPIDYSRILVTLPNGQTMSMSQSIEQAKQSPDSSQVVASQRFVMSLSTGGTLEYVIYDEASIGADDQGESMRYSGVVVCQPAAGLMSCHG